MKNFRVIFSYELKKFFTKRYLFIYLIFAVLCFYVTQGGIDKYKIKLKDKQNFKEIERIKVDQYINYLLYGVYGFRIFFESGPLYSFFNNSNSYSDIIANIDSGEVLDIYNTNKGKKIFEEKAGGFKDFAGINLLFGSLISLIYGYLTFFNRKKWEYLLEFVNFKKLFLFKFFSRLTILLISFLSVFGLSVLLFKINSIEISEYEYKYLFIYLFVLIITSSFFFIIGVLLSMIKSYIVGYTTIIFFWFIMVFFVPGMINTFIAIKAENLTSIYQLEFEELKVMMDFEKRVIEKTKGGSKQEDDNSQFSRSIVENYYKHEFIQLQAFEKKLENEIEKNVRLYQFLSSFFPSTFYISTGNEISSHGYNSFLSFYRYVQELKRKFVRFYIDKKFYSNFPKMKKREGTKITGFVKVESFVKNDENIFRSKPSLPEYFRLGLILLFAYIIILFIISYLRFKTILKR